MERRDRGAAQAMINADSVKSLAARLPAGAALGLSAASGLTALAALAAGWDWLALGLLVLSRLVDFVAEGRMRPVFSALICAGLPFSFALAEPERALAASFFLVAFVVRMTAGSAGDTTVRMPFAGAGTTASCIAFGIAMLFPHLFAILCYGLGVFHFAAAGVQLASQSG